MLINQVPSGALVNVLHDQGVPNTLSGMTFPANGGALPRRLTTGSLALATAVLVAVAAIVIARAIS
jgi:hypothetical protein